MKLKQTTVTTTYLEMIDRNQLKPKYSEKESFEIKQVKIALPELNQFLYKSVGSQYYWIDRLVWTYKQWKEWADRPELETWVAYLEGTPIGYFELEIQGNRNIELAYFGLLPKFIGMGFGGALLTAFTERAWKVGAKRVWLHTCTLDHEKALGNYLARGFKIFKTEMEDKEIPETIPNY